MSRGCLVFVKEETIGGRKAAQQKKTSSWERRFPGTFRTNVPLILPIFSVFSVGGGPKVPRNFVPGNFFFLILGGFSPSETSWETHLLPLLVLTRRGRSTGKNQYW